MNPLLSKGKKGVRIKILGCVSEVETVPKIKGSARSCMQDQEKADVLRRERRESQEREKEN